MDTAAFTFIPDVTASAIVTPATANFGDKVFTIDGTDTVFATTSTLKFPGDDIKVKDIAVLNPTRVTADIVVSSAATVGSRNLYRDYRHFAG